MSASGTLVYFQLVTFVTCKITEATRSLKAEAKQRLRTARILVRSSRRVPLRKRVRMSDQRNCNVETKFIDTLYTLRGQDRDFLDI